ncbi:hypothetical protein GGR54DRAFT_615582 [Hypoxylon sp. NC1633]|nr:hypothetical protein GGR54DRAFT_615582 [Hypoxylon sp. NC1633]
MSLSTLNVDCACSQSSRMASNVSRQLVADRMLAHSGRCVCCKRAPRREGKFFGVQPKPLKSIARINRKFSHIRGYHDDNIECRLQVIRIVAQYNVGLSHEEEVNIAERVYTQLKMVGSPLVDPFFRDCIDELLPPPWEQLHEVLCDQLKVSYAFFEPNETQNFV